MRDAEAQLAIKELQKTIHVLNLEYQEFLNNRNAAIYQMASMASPSDTVSASSRNDCQAIEEELLKVKMREAETQSEKKSISLKLMQLDTEVITFSEIRNTNNTKDSKKMILRTF